MKQAVWLVPIVALGCDVEPSEPVAQPEVVDRDATPSASDDVHARPPSRGIVRGGERMRRRVRWPEAAARSASAYADLDAPSRAAVDDAPVPVLVPGETFALNERRVMKGEHWAAFWGAGDGFTVSLHASGMARVIPGVKPQAGPDTLRHTDAFISQNEGIWSATWTEHGVAYALEIECNPIDAPPCDDARGVEQWAEGLVYVGGRGEAVAQ